MFLSVNAGIKYPNKKPVSMAKIIESVKHNCFAVRAGFSPILDCKNYRLLADFFKRYQPMRQVTIHEAKTNLSRLIQETLNGETVIIAKGKIPLIQLEVLAEAKQSMRIGGASKLNLQMDDGFNDTLDDFSEYFYPPVK